MSLDAMMQRTLNRNLLKYAAGRAIFCPICGNVMDQKRTVIITAGEVTKTMCGQCWDSEVKPKIRADVVAKLDILDGRVEFRRTK